MFFVSKMISSAEELLVTKCKEVFHKKITLSRDNEYAGNAIYLYVKHLRRLGSDLPNPESGFGDIDSFFDQCEGRSFHLAANIIRLSNKNRAVRHSDNNGHADPKWEIDILGIDARALYDAFIAAYQYNIHKTNEDTRKTTVSIRYPSVRQTYGRPVNFGQNISKDEIPGYTDIIGSHKNVLFGTIRDFMSSREIYKKYNMPFKLNILISGPPGTGKTSIVKSIAKKYELRLSIINSKTDIPEFVAHHKERIGCETVVLRLFEEIDIIQEKSDDMDLILQYLDGSLTQSGVINIMTTNYPDKLDSRLLRDGRVDYHLTMDNLTYDEVFEPFRKKYDLTSDEMSSCLAKCKVYEDEKYNPAEIENKIMSFIRMTRCQHRKVEKDEQ